MKFKGFWCNVGRIIGIWLTVAFFVFVCKNYQTYSKVQNSAPFYVFIIRDGLFTLIPSALFLRLSQNVGEVNERTNCKHHYRKHSNSERR